MNVPCTGPRSNRQSINITFTYLISKPSLFLRFHLGWNLGEEVNSFIYQYSNTE